MISSFLNLLSRVRQSVDRKLVERRWENLRARGMHIGKDVWLPATTVIDVEHCFLISIGDHCGFGGQCLILAHDAQMDEFLDAGRVGRVIIHESCHIGSRTIILPGVEIGPRTIVGAGSIVSRSLPPDSVCVGSPAKVVGTLSEYLDRHRAKLKAAAKFDYLEYIMDTTPEKSNELRAAVKSQDAYIVGGRTAELNGTGGTLRTG